MIKKKKYKSCPICNTELGYEDYFLLDQLEDSPDQYDYEVWCPQCQFNLQRWEEGWDGIGLYEPSVDLSRIKEYLDRNQLAVITKKLARNPEQYSRWKKEFIKIKRPGDKIGRYISNIDGKTSLAVIRNNSIIATFRTNTNL